MLHKGIGQWIVFALVGALVLGIGLWLILDDQETPTPPANTAAQTDAPTAPVTDMGLTEAVSTHKAPPIDLDDGNEIYLDTELIAILTEMEKNGEEAAVNEILDWMLLLINRFEDLGYSAKAIRQIQRFYFAEREALMPLGYDAVTEGIADCIPAGGTESESFSDAVKQVFGRELGDLLAFIFATGVPA